MINSLEENLAKLLDSLDATTIDKFMHTFFSIKDFKLIDPSTVKIIKSYIAPFIEDDPEALDNLSLLIAQSLSITGLLKDGVGVSVETISNYKADPNFDYESWDAVAEYNTHINSLTAKTEFINAVGKFTNNQEVLAAATHFVVYHTKANLNEDDKVTRDMALIILLKLCVVKGINKEVKQLLMDMFKIDCNKFITDNIDQFF